MGDKLWKPIKGWERYEVNALGEVRNKDTLHILAQCDDSHGYLTTHLQVQGVRKSPKVHRLIAEYFIPNPDNKPCVNHIDGNKQNNSIDNLEWVTWKENNDHAWLNGLRTKTNNKRVKAIEIATGKEKHFDSVTSCAKSIGASVGNVSRVLIGVRKSAAGHKFEYL